MKLLLLTLLLLQFGPRPALSGSGIAQRDARRVEAAPLTPAESLLGRDEIQHLFAEPGWNSGIRGVDGSAKDGGEIWLTCNPADCELAIPALQRIEGAVTYKRIPRPARSIRVVSAVDAGAISRVKAAIHVGRDATGGSRVLRGLWSTAGIGDEVLQVLAQEVGMQVMPFETHGQLGLDRFGVSTTTVLMPATVEPHHDLVVAAAAYFLATLPNAGSEALLSHLTVGAHARLAEDGRKAVAQMGNQQRASADVLIMFGQAIEREQRRMRSLETFMPTPVDPMLHSRILDMEKGITSVWTSMGITSSPFVPAAQRIRGRGGEDRRVPSRVENRPIPPIDAPTAFLTYSEVGEIMYELNNFIDGKRSISDIRDAVSAEFRPLPISSVTDYFDRLAKTGAITIK